MIRLAALIALWAAPVFASDTWMSSYRSGLTIVPTEQDGCVAEIQIYNRMTDNKSEARGTVSLDDLEVGVFYELNVNSLGSERYSFTPPDGYIAVPQEIVVQDETDGSVLICPWLGG